MGVMLTAMAHAELDTAPLANWIKRQTTVGSLRATFRQERKLPALQQPVSTPGTLLMERPGKMRWELGNPPKTLAISDGTTLSLLEVDKKEARQIAADSPRARQFSLLLGKAFQDLTDFQQTFQLHESRIVSGIYQVTLKPTDRNLAAQVPWVFLDIDPAKNELRALELELKDHSRIRTIFLTTEFNPKLPAGSFQANLSGYKIQ